MPLVEKCNAHRDDMIYAGGPEGAIDKDLRYRGGDANTERRLKRQHKDVLSFLEILFSYEKYPLITVLGIKICLALDYYLKKIALFSTSKNLSELDWLSTHKNIPQEHQIGIWMGNPSVYSHKR